MSSRPCPSRCVSFRLLGAADRLWSRATDDPAAAPWRSVNPFGAVRRAAARWPGRLLAGLLPLFAAQVPAWSPARAADPPASTAAASSATAAVEKPRPDTEGWYPMLEGQELGRRQILHEGEFAKAGQVTLKDGQLHLGRGMPATGVRWSQEFPHTNYEIEWQAQRTEGNDFFCGLSFPVQDGSLTLVAGGWGGWVVGLSCIDERYAIDTDTVRKVEFENDKWYRFRIRVTDKAVAVWIDDQQTIDFAIDGHTLAVSEEMRPSLPLGIATWKTAGSIRQMRYRELPASTGRAR